MTYCDEQRLCQRALHAKLKEKCRIFKSDNTCGRKVFISILIKNNDAFMADAVASF